MSEDIETLRLALRSLQLPISSDREGDALEALLEELDDGFFQEITPGDLVILIGAELREWETSGDIGVHLRTAVQTALRFMPPELESIDDAAYFKIYQQLRTGTDKVPALPHVVAQRLLSRIPLVTYLLRHEKFSCSQVSRVLHATEDSLDVPYGSVSVVARKLGILPSVTEHNLNTLWATDEALSLVLFPDSAVLESCLIASSEVSTWLPEYDVTQLLFRISQAETPGKEPTWPYLQMLHWCLIPVEFYDHPTTYLYEFSPRGKVSSSLAKRYPTVTGNPFLNNAKAVERLTATWARNRGSDDAHALASTLVTLETLPVTARREIARVLRAWLHRIIELHTIEPTLITVALDLDIVESVTDFVNERESHTQGVIEQRVVDYLAVLAFQDPPWRAHGVGDGVNASNLSRRKLGDVEFANVNARTAIALEAHGGHLSSTYVNEHRRSLSRVIEQRLRESWGAIDDAEAWTIRVIFVAHSREGHGLPREDTLHGVSVSYEYMDFHDLTAIAHQAPLELMLSTFGTLVVDALNQNTVRESVRDRFRSILEPKGA